MKTGGRLRGVRERRRHPQKIDVRTVPALERTSAGYPEAAGMAPLAIGRCRSERRTTFSGRNARFLAAAPLPAGEAHKKPAMRRSSNPRALMRAQLPAIVLVSNGRQSALDVACHARQPPTLTMGRRRVRARRVSDRAEPGAIARRIAPMIAALEEGAAVRGACLAGSASRKPAGARPPNALPPFPADTIPGLIKRIALNPGETRGTMHAALHGDPGAIREWAGRRRAASRGTDCRSRWRRGRTWTCRMVPRSGVQEAWSPPRYPTDRDAQAAMAGMITASPGTTGP